jgi:uncharacterized delta-60 repeat protein
MRLSPSFRRPGVAALLAGATSAAAFVLAPVGAAAASGGALDPSFNHTGKVTTSFGAGPGSYAFANGVARQNDGRIVAVGGVQPASGHGLFALARYNRDGSLDQSFGNHGLVSTDIGTGGDDLASSVVVQRDGRIVVAGYAADATNTNYSWALARYNRDGSLDQGFGNQGLVVTSFGAGYDFADAVTLDNRGRIVVAGEASPDHSTKDIGVARYRTDGSLDTSFNHTGMVITDLGHGYASGNGVAVLDGRIVVAGYSSNGTDFDAVVVAYGENGSPDSHFGSAGVTWVDFGPGNDYAHAIAVSDQRIVVAGSATRGSTDFAVAALDMRGHLDTHFGSGGMATIDFGGDDTAFGVGIDSQDRIVAAGDSASGASDQFAVARLRSNGTPDSSFGTAGKVTTDFGQFAVATAMTLQPDDRIVVAGFAGDDFAVARYLSGGSRDNQNGGNNGGGGNSNQS